MRRLAGLTVVAVLTSAAYLPAQDAPPAPTAHAYYPLKLGNVWTYKVTGGPITVKVSTTEKVKDVTAYKIESIVGNKATATELVGMSAKGVVRFAVNGVSADEPILFLPNDPEKMNEWNIDSKAGNLTMKGTFKANKERVTVPLGTYDAIHVKGADMEVGGSKTTIEYWFAKDIGIVKLRFTLGSQDATLELEKFDTATK